MSDDEHPDLLADLGGPLRELAAERDASWAAVARGERDVDEVARERADAGDSSEHIELGRELYRPHTSAERDAMFESLFAEPAPAGSPEPGPTAAANDRSGYARWIALVVALAAAAALVIGWLGSRHSVTEPSRDGPRVAALPSYALETDGGLVDVRAPTQPQQTLHYRQDSEFRWTLRPSVDVEGAVGLRVFSLQGQDTRALATEGLVRVSSTGTVELAGQLAALELAPGDCTIVIVVGREAALPSDPARANTIESDEELAVARLQLVIEP